MENNTEIDNSSIVENPHADLEGIDDVAVLKDMVIKTRTEKGEVETNNRQLFERTKKAEGFEKQEDGSWVKSEKPKAKISKEKSESESGKQQEGLDWGMKAFLRTEGVEATEFDYVTEQMEESGIKDIEKLVKNPYFQSGLKERRDKKAIESAMPKGQRGSGESSKTKAEYWTDKGELPPNTPENRSLRREVIKMMTERERSGSQFTSQSVVHGGAEL